MKRSNFFFVSRYMNRSSILRDFVACDLKYQHSKNHWFCSALYVQATVSWEAFTYATDEVYSYTSSKMIEVGQVVNATEI